jgi:hypothetical protein
LCPAKIFGGQKKRNHGSIHMKSPSTLSHTDSKTREKRLASYCVAGAGAAVLAGTVTTTDASIVYVNYGNQVFNDTTPGDGFFALIPFDIDSNGTPDFQLGIGQGEGFGSAAAIFGPAVGTVGIVGFSSSGFSYASRLGNTASNYDVGPTSPFLTFANGAGRASMAFGPGYTLSEWDTPAEATGILGVRFTIGAQTVYGWIRMNVSANGAAGRTITIIDGAWQTDGTAIHVGAVPEPSTTALGVLALGAIGLVAHRRRVAAQKAA